MWGTNGLGASWSVAIQPGTGNLATVGLECVVSILSSDIDTFGELLSSVKGRGGMGLGIEFVRPPPPPPSLAL